MDKIAEAAFLFSSVVDFVSTASLDLCREELVDTAFELGKDLIEMKIYLVTQG